MRASLLFALSAVAGTEAFRPASVRALRAAPLRVAAVHVTDLDTAQTAELLETQITTWLDEEWIEQDAHAAIGRRASQAYVAARSAGQSEVGEVLYFVGNDLMLDSGSCVQPRSFTASSLAAPGRAKWSTRPSSQALV